MKLRSTNRSDTFNYPIILWLDPLSNAHHQWPNIIYINEKGNVMTSLITPWSYKRLAPW